MDLQVSRSPPPPSLPFLRTLLGKFNKPLKQPLYVVQELVWLGGSQAVQVSSRYRAPYALDTVAGASIHCDGCCNCDTKFVVLYAG